MRETISERRLAGLVAGVVLALAASACAAADPDPASSPASERTPSAPPATQSPASEGHGGGDGATKETKDTSEPPVVPEILGFEAPLVGGGTLKGAELAGAPVAVWFWAPW